MLGYKVSRSGFSYPLANEHKYYIDKQDVYHTQLMMHNGGIREGWKKFQKFMKNIGPKIVHGIGKAANWLADNQAVGEMAQNVIKETTGLDVPVNKATEIIKDIKNKDTNKLLETSKDLFNKWKENRDKANKSNLQEADKKEINDTTDKLLKIDEKQASGLGKNAVYANLVDFKRKGRLGNLTYGIPMNRLEAIGETKRPMKISKKDAGRLFATGSFGGELDPKYVVSEIKKDGKKKGKINVDEEFNKIFGK